MGMSLALGAEVCGSGTPGPRTAVSVVTLPGPSCCRATGLCCATSAPRVLRTFRISGPGLAGCESEAACLDCGGTVGRAVPEHARAGLQRGHISVAISTRAAISPRRFGWQNRPAPRTRTRSSRTRRHCWRSRRRVSPKLSAVLGIRSRRNTAPFPTAICLVFEAISCAAPRIDVG